ncbi:ATP-binding protein [Anaeromyxobacter paludicola]|uniref:histidine kinase n=1 Tax=Anaeromyxobacter paludicola TaxID=2918171 RepID=A0ABN6N943_9BACT|nr:ATP-binding protein [Anaeromyxobacter paludicola]BDG09739.1 hypothetical protein AMPC_28520 [Anaeromyxobacter paludicola]
MAPSPRLPSSSYPGLDEALAARLTGPADDAGPSGASGLRPEVWIPLLYLALSGAWISFSDHLVAAAARTSEEYAQWSTWKGLGFTVVTALLLHAGMRWALERQRRAQQQVVLREALLRAITDALADPVFVKDRAGNFVFANPATLSTLGRRPEEVLGRSDRQIHGDAAVGEAVMAHDRRIVATGQPEALEEWLETPRGRRLHLTTRSPFRDAAREIVGVVGVSRDITERKKAEEQLLQSQKLESIGRLAGGVAHDFNNLLTAILACSASLKEDLARGAAAQPEDVEEILAAGERARDLTRQLLAFARKQVIAPVALDLNAVVRGMQKLLDRLLGEDVELRVKLQPGLWTLHADPGQVEQVILNLVVNARDAMPRGGVLELETRNATEEPAQDPERMPGEWVRLAVRDSGEGMSPEVRAHLFEPFFTTKDPGKGTGLGLATVYGIVQQAGGHAHVQTELGRGTCFELCFPRVIAAAPPYARPVAPQATGGKETVLVVEDEPQVRAVTVRVLRAAGYEVVAAADPREALALEWEEPGRLRLLVTDVVMPGMDGRALAQELRRRHSGLKVLFVSGYPQEIIAERGVLEPGIDFLEKPFTGPGLLSRVRAVLDAG